MAEAMFRFRATKSQDIQERHFEVLDKLKRISWLWSSTPDRVELSRGEESGSCSLNPFLRMEIKGSISYGPRYSTGIPDRAMYDDFLTLDFDENRIHYSEFTGLIFERIVKAFDAYRATVILDIDATIDNHEKIVELTQSTGKDVDGRDTVYRLNPVNYFDDQLCHRAFGYSAVEVVARLGGEVERVSVQDGGALIIVTTDLVDQENLGALHNHIAGLLDGKGNGKANGAQLID